VEADHVFTGLPVADLDAALAWYERLLGRAPDMAPNDDERCWRLAETAWIYVVRDAARAGNGLATILVGDLAAFTAETATRGIDAGEVEQRPGLFRRCVLEDPAGNRLAVAEPLPAERD